MKWPLVLMDAVLGADLEQAKKAREAQEPNLTRQRVNTAILGIYRLLCILRSERFGDAGAASDNGARDASGMPGVRTIIITASFQLCTVCYSSPSEKPRCRWLNEIECDR